MITKHNYTAFSREARRIVFREHYVSHCYKHKWHKGNIVRLNKLYWFLVSRKREFKRAVIIRVIDRFDVLVLADGKEQITVARIWLEKI